MIIKIWWTSLLKFVSITFLLLIGLKSRGLRVFATKYKQIRFFSKFSKNRRYDIINIHFANRYMSFVYKYLRAMSNNIVMSPWGSDILRRPKKNLEQLSIFISKSRLCYNTSRTLILANSKDVNKFKSEPKEVG